MERGKDKNKKLLRRAGIVAGAVLLAKLVTPNPSYPSKDIDIDNPTAKTWYVTIDHYCYTVPPHANLGLVHYSEKQGNNSHHVIIYDASQKKILDTICNLESSYTVINPSRSTYVFWGVQYGEGVSAPESDTVMVDGTPVNADIRTDNGFLVNNVHYTDGRYDFHLSRNLPTVIKANHRSETSTLHFLFRAADFLSWYFYDVESADPSVRFKVKLHNLIIEWYNRLVKVLRTYDDTRLALVPSDITEVTNDVSGGSFDEDNVAKKIIASKKHNLESFLPLVMRIEEAWYEYTEAKKMVAGGEGPLLSPLTELRYMVRPHGFWFWKYYLPEVEYYGIYNLSKGKMEYDFNVIDSLNKKKMVKWVE